MSLEGRNWSSVEEIVCSISEEQLIQFARAQPSTDTLVQKAEVPHRQKRRDFRNSRKNSSGLCTHVRNYDDVFRQAEGASRFTATLKIRHRISE